MIWATVGGVTVGLIILAAAVIKWFPGRKKLVSDPLECIGEALPFVAGWAYGALATLSVGGLIGWAFDTVLWISNWLGDAALWLGVGTDAGVSSRGTYLPLTAQGSSAVLILTGVVIAVIKFRKCGREVKLGAWCGACLGTSAGVAGLAAVPLAQAANWLGVTVYGAMA